MMSDGTKRDLFLVVHIHDRIVRPGCLTLRAPAVRRRRGLAINSKTASTHEGLFKKVKLNRGTPMASANQDS
jgi:hypothetical protein